MQTGTKLCSFPTKLVIPKEPQWISGTNPTSNTSAECLIFSSLQSYEFSLTGSTSKGLLRFHLRIKAEAVSGVLWWRCPWEDQVFIISVGKLVLVGRAVWFCLCACCRALEGCWHRLQTHLGHRGAHPGLASRKQRHRHCRELHCSRGRQKVGRKLRRSEIPHDCPRRREGCSSLLALE